MAVDTAPSRRNPERRIVLADAGLRILAAAGGRGLTHRAVDREAGVPSGTTSNYFRTRQELVGALAERIYQRLAPDPERVEQLGDQAATVESSVDHIRYIVERLYGQRDITLALFELRLEAARNPEVAEILTPHLREGFAVDVEFNRQAGLPGESFEIALLHYAIDGLLFDRLTTTIDPETSTDAIVTALVERLVPAR